MPSKRSRSQERERKRKFREKLSAEAKEADRESARKGMAEMRERKKKEDKNTSKKTCQDHEEEKLYCETKAYAKDIYKKKIGMRKKRKNRTQEEKLMENEKSKDGMRRMREAQTPDKKALENEKSRERMRKQKILQNQKRGKLGYKKVSIMKIKYEKGKAVPDIVERLNESHRLNKERNANESQRESNFNKENPQKLTCKNKILVRNLEKGALKDYKRKKVSGKKNKQKRTDKN